ncbi:MAG: recombination protein RecR [Planctomycetes bacterium]|nr:recombination protein RecR [Planctomycetota bacterium]
MASYSKPVEDLIEALASLPGIGHKTAERLAFHILRSDREEAMKLAEAIRRAKDDLRHCAVCFNITESEVCEICSDPGRDRQVVCVVEQPKDLLAMESTNEYHGVYHVLMGRIAPLQGVTPDQLTAAALVERVKSGQVREVILATNPDLEGDSSALFLSKLLEAYEVKVTRIAKGIPSGSQIEHASRTILSDALRGRQVLHPQAT